MAQFELRIPALPDPGYFSNIKLAALSLARLGGDYGAAPLSVSVGGAVDTGALAAANRWADRFPNITWQPVPADKRDNPFASGFERFARPAQSDVVVLADADLCLLRPIDDVLDRVAAHQGPVIAGMQAHFPPHYFRDNSADNQAFWHAILEDYGFRDHPLPYGYSQIDRAICDGAPPYFNYGFLALNPAALSRIAPLIEPLTRACTIRFAGSRLVFFSAQVALTLAVLITQTDVISLGPEYNCPNSDEMLSHGLRDAAAIRVLHYLRKTPFDRHSFLCRPEAFDTFAHATFAGAVNPLFQAHVLSLEDVFYDEAGDAGTA